MAREIKAGITIFGRDESQSAFVSLINNIDRTDKEFGKLSNGLAPIGRGFKDVGGMIIGAGAAVGGAVIGLVAGAVDLAQGAQQEIDSLNDLSAATGLTVETLSEMRVATQLSGVTAAESEAAYKKFARSIGDVRVAGSKAYKALAALDPVLAKQLRHAKSNDEAFELYMNRLAGVEDITKRTRLANVMFGKSSLFVNQVMRGGADGYKELREEAAKYGIITGDMVDKADAYGDAQDRLNFALAGLKRTVGVELMPALTTATEGLAEFIAMNREDIGQGVAVLAKNLGEGIINLANWIKENPDAITDFIRDAAGAANSLVVAIKDVKTNWEDMQRLFGGDESRQEEAARRAGSKIVRGHIPTADEVASGEYLTRGQGAGGAINSFVEGFNESYSAAGVKKYLSVGIPYYLSEAIIAGVKNAKSSVAADIHLTVPKGMAPANRIVDKDGVRVIIDEDADDFLGQSWS